MKAKFIAAAVLSCLALEASAFWRLPCRGRSSLQRIDPLVSRGAPASHVHTVHGPDTISISSSNEDLMAGSCSSCQVKQDKSAYWTPAMYFQHANTGKLEIVPQTGGMLVYYLQRGDNVTAIPPGLRILAGDPLLRSFPYPTIEKSLWQAQDRTEDALRQKAVGFNCLNYDEPANAALGLRSMPDDPSTCKDGLRAEVFFPSCWDGKRVDAPDHKDHMRYPTLMDDGTCPDTHPIRIISLFFETIWDVGAFSGSEGKYVFSGGDPLGYGYHGDFMNGWDQEVLEQAVAECRDPSGIVEMCGVFEHYTLDEMHSCKAKSIDVKEDVTGPMDKLPGCNPITYGPGRASKATCGDETPVTNPPKNEDNPPKDEDIPPPKDDDNPPKYEDNPPKDEDNSPKDEDNSPKDEDNPPKEEDNPPKVEDQPTYGNEVPGASASSLSYIPLIQYPSPTTQPELVATPIPTPTPVVPEAPTSNPPSTSTVKLHLVVVTVTETRTVDVYYTPPPAVPKRRRHMHGGAHHHHHRHKY